MSSVGGVWLRLRPSGRFPVNRLLASCLRQWSVEKWRIKNKQMMDERTKKNNQTPQNNSTVISTTCNSKNTNKKKKTNKPVSRRDCRCCHGVASFAAAVCLTPPACWVSPLRLSRLSSSCPSHAWSPPPLPLQQRLLAAALGLAHSTRTSQKT